ncbi:hypothetical protein [Neisseria sp. 83E34]|uniref:hypothetical protein n=1 Tax=Neisseria sp. 83E34 TaxID=1692264 RepID=UPI0006CE62C9|nr:hypothetical protein [Neisseria sp. 83E34]KPN70598.1 hypothetical protein AKG09_11280 [Neisseria sp. 83E34]
MEKYAFFVLIVFILFYWYIAFLLCKENNIVEHPSDFFIKNLEINKFLWNLKKENLINIDYKFYILKYGLWLILLLVFIFFKGGKG